MAEMKLIVDVAAGTEKYVPLSAAEIAQRELDAVAAAQAKAEQEAAEIAAAEAKADAVAAAEAAGLTAEQIAALSA